MACSTLQYCGSRVKHHPTPSWAPDFGPILKLLIVKRLILLQQWRVWRNKIEGVWVKRFMLAFMFQDAKFIAKVVIPLSDWQINANHTFKNTFKTSWHVSLSIFIQTLISCYCSLMFLITGFLEIIIYSEICILWSCTEQNVPSLNLLNITQGSFRGSRCEITLAIGMGYEVIRNGFYFISGSQPLYYQ